jgi:hypothetical protein
MSHEFKVVLDGIDLSDDDVEVVNRAVQMAVMGALQSVTVPDDLCLNFPRGCGHGGICGIVVRPGEHPGDPILQANGEAEN